MPATQEAKNRAFWKPRSMNEKQRTDSPSTTFPVVEEQLEVGRAVVDTGRSLRVRKHVEEVPVDVNEPVIQEIVDVERVRLDRVITEPAQVRREGDVTIVPIVEERLVLRKELVLVEEIRLTRRQEVREARSKVNLRRESVVVERFDPQTQQWLSEDEG
jgi:stress response protein YsnF